MTLCRCLVRGKKKGEGKKKPDNSLGGGTRMNFAAGCSPTAPVGCQRATCHILFFFYPIIAKLFFFSSLNKIFFYFAKQAVKQTAKHAGVQIKSFFAPQCAHR